MNEFSANNPSITQTSRIQGAVRLWGDRLRISLAEARTKLSQSGDRGDVNEAAIRDFLREHLPPRYRVGQGEVIDHFGRFSRQLDVVIADDEQPFRVDDAVRLMIIEGVTAAAEVKTTLTTAELRDCLEKGRRFKMLEAIPGKSTMLAAPQIHGKPNSDIARFYQHRPFFVFAYEGAISGQRLVEILSEEQSAAETDAVPSLDAVCILNKGFAVNVWDGNGAFTYYSLETKKMMTSWVWFDSSDYALLWLLQWLHGAMPRFAIRSSPLMAYLLPGTTWTPGPMEENEST